MAKISLNYYWDLLKYIDDDYLTEWEVLKFKDLYGYQIANLAFQHTSAFLLGVGLSYIVMNPVIKVNQIGFIQRLPVAALFGTFFWIQSGNWMRSNEVFHEIIWQPNPHGSYVRKVIRYHFPKWWSQISETLHENGYNLKEMNEYDKQIEMPSIEDRFDTTKF